MADDTSSATPPQSAADQAPHEKAAKAEPSGYKGENTSTAGPGPTHVESNTPENKLGHLNPSAPEDSNTTPGTTGEK